jgi:hypothetical protein
MVKRIYHLSVGGEGSCRRIGVFTEDAMATKIVALFNLKPGISVGDYEAWARGTDIPTVNGLKSVDSFEVFKTVGLLGSEDAPPYKYIEIIDVNDMETFGGEVGGETMQKVAGEFQAMADDLVFILTEQL